MNESQAFAFSELMTSLAVVYKRDLPKAALEIYWQSLKRFEFADVKRALQAHISDPDVGRFLPKPADLIGRLEGSGESKALVAWSTVLKTIERIGSYDSVVFDDALIHAVLADMGGWIALCSHRVEQLKFSQHEFQKRYRRYLEQAPSNYPGVLSGVIARDNVSTGFEAPAPVFIGDKHKARQVMQNGGGERLSIHYPESEAQNQTIEPKNINKNRVSLRVVRDE